MILIFSTCVFETTRATIRTRGKWKRAQSVRCAMWQEGESVAELAFVDCQSTRLHCIALSAGRGVRYFLTIPVLASALLQPRCPHTVQCVSRIVVVLVGNRSGPLADAHISLAAGASADRERTAPAAPAGRRAENAGDGGSSGGCRGRETDPLVPSAGSGSGDRKTAVRLRLHPSVSLVVRPEEYFSKRAKTGRRLVTERLLAASGSLGRQTPEKEEREHVRQFATISCPFSSWLQYGTRRMRQV